MLHIRRVTDSLRDDKDGIRRGRAATRKKENHHISKKERK
jgi:hypothetical protein